MPTDVSIIHAGKDREVAASVALLLRRQGIDVWIDPQPLVWGRTPIESITESTKESKVVLYLCSPAVSEERWIQYEWSAVRQLSSRSNQVLIPVIIEACELPVELAARVSFDLTVGDFNQRVTELANIIRRLLKKRSVFISHSSMDKDSVLPLVRRLRRRRDLAIWYDEDSLRPGSIIRRGIEAGISNADYLIAILSSNVIDTLEGWIGFELDQAYKKERQRNRKGHYFVIPVLIESEIIIPGWLSTKVYVDLTQNFDKGVNAIVQAVSVDIPTE